MLKIVPTPEAAKKIESAQAEICKAVIRDTDLLMRRVIDRIETLEISDKEKSRYVRVATSMVSANVFAHVVAAARLTGISETDSALLLANLAGKSCKSAMQIAEKLILAASTTEGGA